MANILVHFLMKKGIKRTLKMFIRYFSTGCKKALFGFGLPIYAHSIGKQSKTLALEVVDNGLALHDSAVQN